MIRFIQDYSFNMWPRKIIIVLTISTVASTVAGQSFHNAYGLGLITFEQNAASVASASRGIVPVYAENISVANPATWNHLKFAYLSSNYSGNKYASELGVNGVNGLNNIQYIVPIGEDGAWGFGFRTLFNQQYMLKGQIDEFIVDQDTLSTQHLLTGSGGVAALYTGIRFPLTTDWGAGLQFEVLFGSLRRDLQSNLGSKEYHHFQRHLYKGALYKIFIASKQFYSDQIPLNLFIQFAGSINPLAVEQYKFQPFEDVDKNGYYNTNDIPIPTSVPNAVIVNHENVYDPIEFGLGLDYTIRENSHLFFELHSWQDKGGKPEQLFPLSKLFINRSDQVSFSFAKFANDVSFKFYQKIQYRSGIYFRKDQLIETNNNIYEVGLSMGIGIKFSVANNQLDLAYKIGMRRSQTLTEESVQQLTIGVSIGDRWFVKRRPTMR